MAAAGPLSFFILFYCLCSSSTPGLLSILPVSADDLAFVYHNCLRNATLADATTNSSISNSLSSTFKNNLNWAVHNLTKLASDGANYAVAAASSDSLCLSTAQNLTSFGQNCHNARISDPSSPVDTVYAMFQCRGDQSSHECATCLANASAMLSQSRCPASIGARIQLDGCYLRYDNQSYFMPNFTRVTALCSLDKTDDPVVVSAIDSLVSNVTTEAPQNNGYASKSANIEYGLAQCLGFLNNSECLKCLTSFDYRRVCPLALGGQVHLESCYYRFEPYSFFTALAPPPASLQAILPSSHTQGSKVAIISGVVIGGVLALAVICLALLVRRHRNPKRRVQAADNDFPPPLFTSRVKVFPLHDLEVATEHFHDNNKLGVGGFGSVYKGTLQNGQLVAVKKLSLGGLQGRREFMNEVNLITTVQHKNLIELLGSCVEGPERILVYEYLPNGSLDKLLFGDANKTTTLDWQTRHGIILGMARGLTYLHEESHIHIIHRDIKPSNILLDDHLNPVIGDFGMARLISDDESYLSTQMAGTIGYVAPEYIVSGKLTEKVDVFSFGVVTLEIITGKRNSRDKVVEQIWELYQNRREMELVDPKMDTSFSTEEVVRAIHIGLLCIQENSNLRPKMSSIVLLLSGNSLIMDLPTKPAYLS